MSGPSERDEVARLIRDAVRIRPFGPNSRQIHDNGGTVHLTGTEANEAADALMDWLAERDRRVAASALRDMGTRFRNEGRETWGGDVGWTTTGSRVAVLAGSWCEAEADRIERGA